MLTNIILQPVLQLVKYTSNEIGDGTPLCVTHFVTPEENNTMLGMFRLGGSLPPRKRLGHVRAITCNQKAFY